MQLDRVSLSGISVPVLVCPVSVNCSIMFLLISDQNVFFSSMEGSIRVHGM